MAFTRNAQAIWEGTGKDGKGILTTESTVLNNTQYSFSSRFESGVGTNPEELIAAAHAGCFAMKLSFVLNEMGFTANKLDTKCDVTFDNGKITKSHLVLKADIPNISSEDFAKATDNAKANCPISVSLTAEITLDATLV
jgi:osmotically inducible protein OsmC